jgi:hypothetical protein
MNFESKKTTGFEFKIRENGQPRVIELSDLFFRNLLNKVEWALNEFKEFPLKERELIISHLSKEDSPYNQNDVSDLKNFNNSILQ